MDTQRALWKVDQQLRGRYSLTSHGTDMVLLTQPLMYHFSIHEMEEQEPR